MWLCFAWYIVMKHVQHVNYYMYMPRQRDENVIIVVVIYITIANIMWQSFTMTIHWEMLPFLGLKRNSFSRSLMFWLHTRFDSVTNAKKHTNRWTHTNIIAINISKLWIKFMYAGWCRVHYLDTHSHTHAKMTNKRKRIDQ